MSSWFKKLIIGGNVVRFAANEFMQIRALMVLTQFASNVSITLFAMVNHHRHLCGNEGVTNIETRNISAWSGLAISGLLC
jgi:hypothetical protein